MDVQRLRHRMDEFKKALFRLEESLRLPLEHSIVIDGVIQRFEFTYELAWKCLKDVLEYKGMTDAKAPRDVMKQAFAIGLIENGDGFLSMLKDRNLSAHTYDEKMSVQLYEHIRDLYFPLLIELVSTFEKNGWDAP